MIEVEIENATHFSKKSHAMIDNIIYKIIKVDGNKLTLETSDKIVSEYITRLAYNHFMKGKDPHKIYIPTFKDKLKGGENGKPKSETT